MLGCLASLVSQSGTVDFDSSSLRNIGDALDCICDPSRQSFPNLGYFDP